MPSKKPHTCPICQRPGLINLGHHLNGEQERKQLIQRGIVGSEVMIMEIKAVTSCSTQKIDQQETDG